MNNESTKIYVPKSSAKQVDFRNGNSILKLSFKVEEFVAFLQQNANARGYVNLGVSKRKEVGKFGDTHCIWLDTWQPTPQGAAPAPTAPAEAAPPTTTDDGNDSVPF